MSLRDLAREIYRVEQLATAHATAPQLGHSSTDSGVDIVDDDGNVVGTVGRQDDGGVAVKPLDGPTPPPPSTPVVDWEWGIIHVRWDGNFAGGDDSESDGSVFATSDLACIDVYASTSPTYLPPTSGDGRVTGPDEDEGEGGGSLDAADGSVVEDGVGGVAVSSVGEGDALVAPLSDGDATGDGDGDGEEGLEGDEVLVATIYAPPEGGASTALAGMKRTGEWYIRLVARSTAGKVSAPSEQATVMVNMTSVSEELWESWIKADDAMVTADGKNTIHGYGGDQPPVEGAKDGDLWFDDDHVPHTFDEYSGEWVTVTDARITALQNAEASLRGELEAVKNSAKGDGSLVHYSPSRPDESKARTGDVWFDTSLNENGEPVNRVHVFDASVGRFVYAADERLARVEKAQEGLKSDLSAVKATADGKNQSYYQPTEPAGALVKGDLWFDTSPSGGNRPNLWDGSKWVSVADLRVAHLLAMQDNLGRDLAGVRESVDGKTSIRWEASVPTSATPGSVVGDTWHQYKGGKHVGTWRWDGKTWVQQSFDPVMIPTVDIGTGTFGELDGARLKANTVVADSVLVKGSVGSTVIADGAITTDKIATGAITAESGVVGSLDAGKITVGELDGARIQAGSVTADKLLVGTGQNLVADPEFTSFGSTGWTGITNGEIVPSEGVYGSPVLRFPTSDASTGSYLGLTEDWSGYRAKVSGGTRYRMSAYVRASDFSGDSTVAQLYLRFYTPADKAVGGLTWGSQSNASFRSSDLTDGEWTLVSFETVAPEGAVEAAPGLYKYSSHTTSPVEFCLPTLQSMTGSTLIEPGAITTEKIATGAITAESGVIGSLDLGKATVGELDGSRIKAGTVAADRVLIGSGGNVIPNGDGLTTSNNGFTGIDFDVEEKALVMPGSGNRASSATFRVEPGEYELSADIKGPAGSHVYVGVMDDVNRWAYGINNVTITDAWKTYTSTLTVDQARSEQPQVVCILPGYNDKLPASEKTWIRNISLRKKVGSTVIADGAVTTEKIATGAITANSGVIGSLDASKITTGQMNGKHIKANTIASEQLAAGAVKAGILDANAINGMTITGATLRTSAKFPRVELNSKGLFSYAKDGKQTFSALSGTGDVNLVGSLYSDVPGARRVVIDNNLWTNKQYLSWWKEIRYADATGIRLGKDADDMTHGTVSYAEVYTAPMPETTAPENLKDDGTAPTVPPGRESYVPHFTLEGPGSSVARRSRIHLVASGQTLMDFANGFRIRSTEGSEFFSMYSDGGVRVRSRKNAEMLLDTNGDATLRAAGTGDAVLSGNNKRTEVRAGATIGLKAAGGATASLARDITLESRNTNPIILTTGEDGAFIVVSHGSSKRNVHSASRHDFYGGEIWYHDFSTVTYNSNAYIGTTGRLSRGSASSRRYKVDIQDYDVPEALLNVPFRTWVDKTEAEEAGTTEGLTRLPGLIAEEVAEADPTFVIYDQDGRPDALHGDRIGMAALTLIRKQRDRISALEERLTALEKMKG